MSNLFQKIREANSHQPPSGSSPTSGYSWGGSPTNVSHPFRDRPGTSSTSTSSMVVPNGRPAQNQHPPRNHAGDRPHAYAPPPTNPHPTSPHPPRPPHPPGHAHHPVHTHSQQPDPYVYEWQPPSFGAILADLGLRILERGIAAAAFAIGEEIAYFFKERRFYTEDQWKRRKF